MDEHKHAAGQISLCSWCTSAGSCQRPCNSSWASLLHVKVLRSKATFWSTLVQQHSTYQERQPKYIPFGSIPRPGVPASGVRHEGCEGLSPSGDAQGVPTRRKLLLAAGSLSEMGSNSCLCLATSLPGSCFQTGKSH